LIPRRHDPRKGQKRSFDISERTKRPVPCFKRIQGFWDQAPMPRMYLLRIPQKSLYVPQHVSREIGTWAAGLRLCGAFKQPPVSAKTP